MSENEVLVCPNCKQQMVCRATNLKEVLSVLGYTVKPPIRTADWETIYQRDVYDKDGGFIERMSSYACWKWLRHTNQIGSVG